jgi:hypothetical protein
MSCRNFTAFLLCLIPLAAFSQSVPADPGTLAVHSDIVVVGKVGSRISEWTSDRSRIQTRVTIAVTDAIKGTGVPEAIEVVVPGGEVDGVGEWYSHTTRFAQDEDVVLFANSDHQGKFRVAGGEGGKLSITTDRVSGEKVIPRVGSLARFTAALRKIIPAQDAGTRGH